MLTYFLICRTYGDLQKCRKLLLRAVNSASDDAEMVCDTLLQLEREQGCMTSCVSSAGDCLVELSWLMLFSVCSFVCLFVLGTLETFEAALDRCSAQLQRIKERKEKVCYLFLNT